MNTKSLVMTLYPYWILGALMIWATVKAGHKDLIRVDKKAIKNWCKFILILTIYRLFLFKFFPSNPLRDSANVVTQIPIPITLMVFWEDACHALPLLLVRYFIGTKWWSWPIHILLMAAAMLEFGLGHMYQGVWPAVILSFYIPYSIRLAKKYGLGTVMLGHTLYDLATVAFFKILASG